MIRRAFLAISTSAMTMLCGAPDFAGAQTGAAEALVREAIARYETRWNQHDVQAWTETLTEDVEFIGAYGRMPSRSALSAAQAPYIKQYHYKMELLRLRMEPNGTATAVVRTTLRPRDGQYASVIDRQPVVTRWRLDGNEWKLFYFNNNSIEARAILKAEGLE